MKSARIHHSLPVLSVTYQTVNQEVTGDHSTGGAVVANENVTIDATATASRSPGNPLTPPTTTSAAAANETVRSPSAHSRSSSCLIGHRYWHNQFITDPFMMANLCQSPVDPAGHLEMEDANADCRFVVTDVEGNDGDGDYSQLPMVDTSPMARASDILNKHQGDLEEALGRLEAADQVYKSILSVARNFTYDCDQQVFQDVTSSSPIASYSKFATDGDDEVDDEFQLQSHLGHRPPAITTELVDEEDELNESFFLTSDSETIRHFLKSHSQFLSELSEYESAIHNILLQGQSLLALISVNCRRMSQQQAAKIEIKVTQESSDEVTEEQNASPVASTSSSSPPAKAQTSTARTSDQQIHLASPKSDSSPILKLNGSTLNLLKSHASQIRTKFTCLLDTVQEREESLTRALISVTQRHLDNLKSWTLYAEDRIVYFEEIGPDFESLIRQCEDHRVLQDELDDQQGTLDMVSTFLSILEDENNDFGLHISSSLLADFHEQVSNLIRDKWNHLSSSIIERSAILSVIHDEWSNLNQLEEQIKHLACSSVKCRAKRRDEAREEQMKSLPCHSSVQEGESPREGEEVNLDMAEVNLAPSVKESFGSSCENVPGTSDTDNESLEELMANLVDCADSLLTQLTSKCPTVSINPDTLNEVRSQMSRLQESLNQIKVTLESSNNPSPGQSLTLPSDHNSGDLTNYDPTGDEKYPCYLSRGTTSCSGEFKAKCDEIQDEMDNSNNCNINEEGECLTIKQTNTGLLNNSSPGSTRTAMTSLSNADDDRLLFQQHQQEEEGEKRSQQLPDPCIPHAWRVKEWQRDMETVSTWLGRIEDDLGLEDDLSENGSVIWDHLSHQEQLFLLNDISLSVAEKTSEINSLINEGHEIISELQSVGKTVKIYSELLSTVTLRWSMIQQELQVKTEAIESEAEEAALRGDQCASATGDSAREDSLDIDSPLSGAVEMADVDSHTPDHMLPPRSPWMSHGPLVGQITRWQRAAETLSIWLGRLEDDLGLDDGDVNCAVVIWDELSIDEQQGLLEDSTAAVNEKSQEIESLISSGKKISSTIKSLEASSSTSGDSLPVSTIRPFNELLRSLVERWSLVKNELERKKLRLKAISELHQLNMEVESMRRVLVSHQKWLQVTESLLNQSCNLTKLMNQFKLRSRSMNIQKERLDKVKEEITAIINSAPFDLTNNDSYKSLQCFIQCWQVIYDRNNQLNERIQSIALSDRSRRSESTDEELISISDENLSQFLLHPASKSPTDDPSSSVAGDATVSGDRTTPTQVDSATLVTASNESSTLISGRFNYNSPLLKNSPLEPSPAISGSIGESSVTTSHEQRSMNPMSVYQSSVAYQVLPEEDEEQVIQMATDETKQLVTLEEDDEYEEVEVEVNDDDDEYEEVEEGTDSDINCGTNDPSLVESSATRATIDPPDSTSMVLSTIFSSLEQVEDEFHQEILGASNVQADTPSQVTDSIEADESHPLIAHEIIPQNNFFTTEGGRGSEQQQQQHQHQRWPRVQHDHQSSDQGTSCSSSSTSSTTTTTSDSTTAKSLFKREKCIKCNSSRCQSITTSGDATSESKKAKFILEQSLQSTAIQLDQSSEETSVQIDTQFNGYTCPSCIVNINCNTSLPDTNVTHHQHGYGDGGGGRRRHNRRSPFGQDTGHSLPTQRSTSSRKRSFSSRIESTLVTLIQYLAVVLLIGLQAISLSIIGLTLFLFLSWMSLVLLLAIAAASAIVKMVLIYTAYLVSPAGQVFEELQSARPSSPSMPWLPSIYSLGHGGLFITNAFNVTLFLACLFFVILSFNILAYKNKLHMSLYLPGKNGSPASSSGITKTTTLGLAFIWTHIFKVTSLTSSTVTEVKGASNCSSNQYELLATSTNIVDETLHESSLSLSEVQAATSDMSGYLTWTWLPFKFCITNYTWIPLLKLNRSKSKYPVTQM